MVSRPHLTRLLCCTAVGLGLSACGGGEIGGTVSGLGTGLSVTLLNNGGDALTVSRNGRFAFVDTLGANDSYEVSVGTQPVGQTCSVANGTGTIDVDGASVDDLRVSCTFSASLRGVVSGLRTGAAVTLRDGSQTLAIAADGPFAFARTLADGSAYAVDVLTQPLGGSCVVQNGSGVFVAASFVDIAVLCN